MIKFEQNIVKDSYKNTYKTCVNEVCIMKHFLCALFLTVQAKVGGTCTLSWKDCLVDDSFFDLLPNEAELVVSKLSQQNVNEFNLSNHFYLQEPNKNDNKKSFKCFLIRKFLLQFKSMPKSDNA
jgi:hypothetical protein